MSPFDVHVNRIPVSGKICRRLYTVLENLKLHKGDIEKENEKNLVVIDSEFGKLALFRLQVLLQDE